jgi:hypothetical protein
MINRKALWISILVLFAMIAANLWRLSLLPDWRHVPVEGPGSRSIPVFWTFVPPMAVLFTMGIFFARKWLRSGPEEAVQRWSGLYGAMLLFNTAICASAEAFNLARSMGALQSIDRPTLAHSIMVVTGVSMVLVGNMTPKMPWLTSRFRYAQLDPWQWNQHVRFSGKLAVVAGLFFAVGMPLLPLKITFPLAIGLALVVIAVNHWHRAKVRGASSPQP